MTFLLLPVNERIRRGGIQLSMLAGTNTSPDIGMQFV